MNNQTNSNQLIKLHSLSWNHPKLCIDFSMLHNPELFLFCQNRFQEKLQENVSRTYLKVLSTSVIHYDQYLTGTSVADYSMLDKESYWGYLERISDPSTGMGYSQKYIRFLTSSIDMLLNKTA